VDPDMPWFATEAHFMMKRDEEIRGKFLVGTQTVNLQFRKMQRDCRG